MAYAGTLGSLWRGLGHFYDAIQTYDLLQKWGPKMLEFFDRYSVPIGFLWLTVVVFFPTRKRSRTHAKSDATASPIDGVTTSLTGRADIQFSGPDGILLRIFPRGDRFIGTIFNRGTRVTPKLSLHTLEIQTFDAARETFRKPIKFRTDLAKIDPLQDDQHGSGFTVLQKHPNRIEVGDRKMLEYLPWPEGDQSTVKCWLITMSVRGLQEEWKPRLVVRWEQATGMIGLGEYNQRSGL